MNIATSRFGTIDCPEQALLAVPAGILGFPASTRYVVLDHDRDVPFKWLQSVDEPALAFVIADPVLFAPEYRVVLLEQDTRDLGVRSSDDLLIFVIVTIPLDDPIRFTANLRGPVVVNRHARIGKQVILQEDYPTRAPLAITRSVGPVEPARKATLASVQQPL